MAVCEEKDERRSIQRHLSRSRFPVIYLKSKALMSCRERTAQLALSGGSVVLSGLLRDHCGFALAGDLAEVILQILVYFSNIQITFCKLLFS